MASGAHGANRRLRIAAGAPGAGGRRCSAASVWGPLYPRLAAEKIENGGECRPWIGRNAAASRYTAAPLHSAGQRRAATIDFDWFSVRGILSDCEIGSIRTAYKLQEESVKPPKVGDAPRNGRLLALAIDGYGGARHTIPHTNGCHDSHSHHRYRVSMSIIDPTAKTCSMAWRSVRICFATMPAACCKRLGSW